MPSITLPAEVASAPLARRWLVDHLAGVPEDIVESATLLTSELVANAILHAGTASLVSVHHLDDRIRIGVIDGSPVPPANKEYGSGAATGRGLTLVERVAHSWGTTELPGGKVVWFELLVPGRTGSPSEPGPEHWPLPDWLAPAWAADGRGAMSPTAIPVVVEGIPVDLMRRTGEHYDALSREFRLMVERDRRQDHTLPRRLVDLVEKVGPRKAAFMEATGDQRQRATARGDTTFDLAVDVPPDSGPYCEELDRLLDESDAYCESADLITLPPAPECTALRKWLLNEFVRQVRGEPPVPWPASTQAGMLRRTGYRADATR